MASNTLLLLAFSTYSSRRGLVLHNPAEAVAESLNGEEAGNCTVKSIVLRVYWRELERVRKLLGEEPRAAIGLGLNPSIEQPVVELAAANIAYGRDFEGVEYSGKPLDPREPLGRVYSIPVDVAYLRDCLAEKGYRDARFSVTVGSYLCNALAYTLYSWSHRTGRNSVFIHVPPTGNLSLELGTAVSIDLGTLIGLVKAAATCICR